MFPEDETGLIKHLFTGYDKRARPVLDNHMAVNVSLLIQLLSFNGVACGVFPPRDCPGRAKGTGEAVSGHHAEMDRRASGLGSEGVEQHQFPQHPRQ